MTLSEQIAEDRKKKIWSGEIPKEEKHFQEAKTPAREDVRHGNCLECGKKLVGQQKKFCSKNCSGRYFARENGGWGSTSRKVKEA